MRIEIQHLRAFVAIAAEGALARASRRLFLSQPAVSAQLKHLEDALDVVLFERSARGMVLTPRGRALLADAQAVLASVEVLEAHARRYHGETSGRFRLGAASDAQVLRLGTIVGLLATRFPAVEIVMSRAPSHLLLDALARRELDGAFVYASPSAPPRQGLRLERVDVFLAAPQSRGLAPGCDDLSPFLDAPWVLTPATSCCRNLAESLFRQHGRRPNQIVEADTESTARALIAAGVGVGLLHAPSAHDEVEEGRVSLAAPLGLAVDLWFAVPATTDDDPVLRAVTKAVREAWRRGPQRP